MKMLNMSSKASMPTPQEITQFLGHAVDFFQCTKDSSEAQKHFQLESEVGLITGQYYWAYNSVILIFESMTLS